MFKVAIRAQDLSLQKLQKLLLVSWSAMPSESDSYYKFTRLVEHLRPF